MYFFAYLLHKQFYKMIQYRTIREEEMMTEFCSWEYWVKQLENNIPGIKSICSAADFESDPFNWWILAELIQFTENPRRAWDQPFW